MVNCEIFGVRRATLSIPLAAFHALLFQTAEDRRIGELDPGGTVGVQLRGSEQGHVWKLLCEELLELEHLVARAFDGCLREQSQGQLIELAVGVSTPVVAVPDFGSMPAVEEVL